MYNNFIHEQKVNILMQEEQQQSKQQMRKRKYQIQTRPALVEQYHKRVTSFIRQIDQKPIKNIEDVGFKASASSLKKFVFRNNEDWISYDTTISKDLQSSRSERKTIKRVQSVSNHINQFTNYKQQFRTRNRQLQIHAPMTFNRPHKSNHCEQKRKKQKEHPQCGKTLDNAHQHSDKITVSLWRNESHRTIKSTLYNPFSHHNEESQYFPQSKYDNIELQAQQYEKQQQLVEKKYHFKTLVNMSLRNKNVQSRKQFRKILEKNGYVKAKIKIQNNENPQLDHLSLIVDGHDNQSY